MNTTFKELNISDSILKSLDELNYKIPTEVQKRAIPYILNEHDLIVMSKTGSGKTAAFGIPIFQMTDPDTAGPQALILTPTRELTVQVDNDLKHYSKHLRHRTCAVYGQHSMNTEILAFKKGVTVVTGTPGRVFDHIQSKTLNTKHIRFLVLDEADRMLDMGFIDQIVKIIRTLPNDRITLLFSATMPPEIRTICRDFMKNPELVEIESETKTVDSIHQIYYRVEKNQKRAQLYRVLNMEKPESCIIFCNTKREVENVQRFLSQKGYAPQSLHGDIPQGKRTKTIHDFKTGAFTMLVATDVAARGIHVDNLSLVINYDVPVEKDSYVHRIGRTGRAGSNGRAISLVTSDDIYSLYEIEEHTGAMIIEGELSPIQSKSEYEYTDYPKASIQQKKASVNAVRSKSYEKNINPKSIKYKDVPAHSKTGTTPTKTLESKKSVTEWTSPRRVRSSKEPSVVNNSFEKIKPKPFFKRLLSRFWG